MKWTKRWIARAQRKADIRTERFLRHEEGVRAGTEPPGRLARIAELGKTLHQAFSSERYVNADWPVEARPYDASLRLANAWLTWVKHGPICGPDDIEVSIWIRSAGQDLPYHYAPDGELRLTRQQHPASQCGYTVCIRRMPAGPVESIRSFATEPSARWYAIGLARQVREVGLTALRPTEIHGLPQPPPCKKSC